MLNEEQKRALSDVLQDYWQEIEASDIIDDVVRIADPIEAAKYLEAHALSNERIAAEGSSEEKEYYLTEARKFRNTAQLLRQGG